MKNITPFWTWNKRKSPMTLTPRRVASGKPSIIQRTLRGLSEIRFGRDGMKALKAARKLTGRKIKG